MKDKIPILKGFVTDRQIRVWCPFCQRFHTDDLGLNRKEVICRWCVRRWRFKVHKFA